ncbi:fatty acid desaturase family protein [Agromyces larvae]|uniref:Acyl-CoA desaturase n=1 Tax=Agromyces larvae TaxID=2929802 RepID=A0ABY4BXZ7_9MICO|nr:acyl-CoA desaturase [Agromyces larvae]UOE44062.1 acyl-CoA desaturase [Agromyces larvae]
MTDSPTVSTVRVVKTTPRSRGGSATSEYSALLQTVKNLGLLRRRTGFYWAVFGVLVACLGGAIAGFVLLGDSWFQLLIAGALGILFTQFAFLAHEASHRQVFQSGPANDRAGRILANGVVGISYSWWMHKHSRHHANPNVIGKDPDIANDVIVFQEAEAAKVPWLHALIVRKQGWWFFPLLLLEGLNLHVHGLRTVMGPRKVDRRWQELTMIVLRLALYLGAVFAFLPLGMAFAFVGVQLAVFGLYMGASFAPNHKGMPQLPHDSKVDFLRRQVLTSRNIRGGWGMLVFMGGLNYQAEHHLFPNMPRPNLRKAAEIVREYCQNHGIVYTETSLVDSYAIVVRYLNQVGLSARDPFDCPMVAQFRVH